MKKTGRPKLNKETVQVAIETKVHNRLRVLMLNDPIGTTFSEIIERVLDERGNNGHENT